MATNSSIFSGSSTAKYQVLHLVFNQVSQDVANNRTLFSYEAYIQGVSGGNGSSKAGSYSITGATTTSASGQSWSWNTTTKQTISTGSFYVNHNSDGTLATQTLSISASFKTTSGTLTSSTSVSLTVPTIPRASQPSLNVSTQALGSAITISTNRASTSFTHTLTYAFGNQSGTIATGVTTSQAWKLPESLANAIPNATSGTGTITCKTFNESTEIGTKSVSFTATVPDSPTFKPTATINSIVEDGDVPPSISEFVQSKTKFNIVSSGTGKYSAKISNYQITVDEVNYYGSSVITGFINTSGNRTITLKVTDTRGYSTTVSTTRNVVAYSPPTITTFRVYRSTSVQNMAHIEFGGTFTELVGNTRYFQVSSKSSEPQAQFVEETSSDGVEYFPAEFWIGQGMNALDNLSYTLRFTVQDSFSSVVRTIDLATAFKLINFNASGKGMAIGKVSQSDSFEVAIPTKAYQPITDGNTNNPYLYKSTTTTINTFENGWEGYLTFSRYGDLVSIKGALSKTGTVTNGTQVATIPVDFRPHTTTPIAVAKGNTSPYNSSYLFWLTTGGGLVMRTSDTIPANLSNSSLGINQIYSV